MQLGNSMCTPFESDGVVCPIKLRSYIFTTFTADNIDHNPSSRSAKKFLTWSSNFFNTAPRIKDRWNKTLFCQVSRHCFKGFAASSKGIHDSASFVLKSTDVYVPRLPKRDGFRVHILLLQIYKPEAHLPTSRMKLCVTKVDEFQLLLQKGVF